MPVIIRDIDDDSATLAMVDANLHREKLLPSEKGRAYRMKLEALKHKAGRPSKENVCQVGKNFRADEELVKDTTESARTIHRYIRLTYLKPELLDMVDRGSIKTGPGEEISFLPEDEQNILLEVIKKVGNEKISLSQAKELHQMSKDGDFSEAAVFKLFSVGSMKERRIVLGEDILMRYFHADMTDDEMKRIIIRLLDDWAEGRR